MNKNICITYLSGSLGNKGSTDILKKKLCDIVFTFEKEFDSTEKLEFKT